MSYLLQSLPNEDKIYIITGNNKDELMLGLNSLQQNLNQDLVALMQSYIKLFKERFDASYRCIVIASSSEQLKKEISWMLQGVEKCFATGCEWKTPHGSCFSMDPIKTKGKISFVYPGINSAEVDVGKKILQYFPSIYNDFNEITEGKAAELMQASILYPQKTKDDSSVVAGRLHDHVWKACAASLSLSWVHTNLFEKIFEIKPQTALGYSAGETSMIASLNIWKNPYEWYQNVKSASTFNEDLAGNMLTLRKYWGDLDVVVPNEEQEVWSCYIIKISPNVLLQEINKYKRIYFMAINTATECMVGGYPSDIDTMIDALGVKSLAVKVNINLVVHAKPTITELNKLVAIKALEARQMNIPLYTSSSDALYSGNAYDIARTLAKSFCEPINFPRLINKTYEDGVRFYLEMGGNDNCTFWIKNILQKKQHVAVASNVYKRDDFSCVLRALGQLITNGYNPNLSVFCK